jgi:hypothetical protein
VPAATETDTDADQTVAGSIEAAVDWHAFVPTDVADHLATMDRAARDSDCGVPWQLLASIARVESDFGRNMATSSAGAIGYGQFLPSSWQAFGNQGNAYDYRDALPAIALYLCQAGLERDPRVALFAYNHADWYVDMVLDLAVRYDRMAPGSPVPDVLDIGPAQQSATEMHYAAGRDVRLQARLRSITSGARWLGVPWKGRSPGQAIAATTMQTTTLNMVRAALGLTGDVADSKPPANQNMLQTLANRAWDAGLLPISAEARTWTLENVRLDLARGEPVIISVGAGYLPGHPPGEDAGDQPLVLIGTTPTGFIYSDPSFSSSLGYGLELGGAELQAFWDAASVPRQALAFTKRPAVPTQTAHLSAADPPPPIARVLPTPTVEPAATLVPTSPPTATPIPPVLVAPATTEAALPRQDASDPSWFIIVSAAVFVGGAFGLRRWRARRFE